MSPPSMPVAEELDSMLLELGSALFVAQGLEGTLVFLLSVCAMEDADMADGAFAASMDSLSEKTLGQLLKRLAERVDLTDIESSQFKQGWESRNWIVHRFLHDTVEQMMTPKGRLQTLKRLTQAKAVVKTTDRLANTILDRYVAKFGITVDDMKASADRMWDHLNPRLSGQH